MVDSAIWSILHGAVSRGLSALADILVRHNVVCFIARRGMRRGVAKANDRSRKSITCWHGKEVGMMEDSFRVTCHYHVALMPRA